VHRFRDFEDVTYLDFLTSAAAIAPVLAGAENRTVGMTVLEAVQRSRLVAPINTNLGILLLLAPLARASGQPNLRVGVEQVLSELTVADAVDVYQAIRLARPGGLGRVPEQDVAGEPTQTLRQVMTLAADRDLVARQYANGFREIFEEGVPALERGLRETGALEDTIIHCHLHLLAHYPDSLISRKRGQAEAEEAARRARLVLKANWPWTPGGRTALAELDGWLRAEGHGRNPGTTADLVTACLFVALRSGTIQVPLCYPWSAGCQHE
jgi:triphosphoribosyl-dephospho-CoA synthase